MRRLPDFVKEVRFSYNLERYRIPVADISEGGKEAILLPDGALLSLAGVEAEIEDGVATLYGPDRVSGGRLRPIRVVSAVPVAVSHPGTESTGPSFGLALLPGDDW